MIALEVLQDVAKLGFFVLAAYLVLQASLRRWRPGWSADLTRRRFAVIGTLALAMVAVKVIEDVVSKESGPVDTAILWFVREYVPAALTPFFAVLTLSGSMACLLPLSAACVLAAIALGRRSEAGLILASTVTAALMVYGLKAVVARDRPALWPTQWYWGTSFPSGHTLVTAALAGSVAWSLGRIWPRHARAAMVLGWAWTGMVAMSRLVLGVHWPSDVLAALCLGALIPLAFRMAMD